MCGIFEPSHRPWDGTDPDPGNPETQPGNRNPEAHLQIRDVGRQLRQVFSISYRLPFAVSKNIYHMKCLFSLALVEFLVMWLARTQGEQECESTGSLFVREGQEERLKRTDRLLSNLNSNGKLTDDAVLRRWDGELGNFQTHLNWMLEHAKSYTDVHKKGFRHYGQHNGITYEIEDELTKSGGGEGYFRLSGEVDISPELVIAQVMDAQSLGELDPTVMYMNFLHRYTTDRNSRLCLWIAAPGFPFQWRMGLDLTTWKVDENGTYWQVNDTMALGTSIPHCFLNMLVCLISTRRARRGFYPCYPVSRQVLGIQVSTVGWR